MDYTTAGVCGVCGLMIIITLYVGVKWMLSLGEVRSPDAEKEAERTG